MDYSHDISRNLAVAAFSGTSFTPERRAEQYINDYASTLQADYERLAEQADKGGTTDLLGAEFAQYRDGYAKRYRAWLNSKSRIVSTMIAGGSNFPVRRMEKRNSVERARGDDLMEFRKRALKAITSKLRPDLAPIMSGDSDAVSRLRAELESLQARQAHMKAVNAAHKAYLKKPASLDTAELPESTKQTIRDYKPAYSWEPHPFAPFQLTNNGANIRRIEARIAQVSATQAMPTAEREGTNARIEDDPPANRVRLFFPDKPSEDVRSKLKSNGFRWSPTIGAWQAYRNTKSLSVAQEVAG